MSLKLKEQRNEEGFTLIELLVVVIIIGILAAIAIPVFLNQRESAWRSAVESDVRNAAIAVETFFTQERSYPDATEFGTMITDGDIQESTDVDLTYAPAGGTDGSYLITGDHSELDESVTFDAGAGGLQDWA